MQERERDVSRVNMCPGCVLRARELCGNFLVQLSDHLLQSELDVFEQYPTPLRDSVEEHLSGHQQKGLAVHGEPFRVHVAQLVLQARVQQPCGHILSAPLPWVYREGGGGGRGEMGMVFNHMTWCIFLSMGKLLHIAMVMAPSVAMGIYVLTMFKK